jgi:pimeloyl-ACP methyl ester carboxylesterase
VDIDDAGRLWPRCDPSPSPRASGGEIAGNNRDKRGEALSRAIGQSQFEIMEGVGHLPQLEAPDRVLQAVSGFL